MIEICFDDLMEYPLPRVLLDRPSAANGATDGNHVQASDVGGCEGLPVHPPASHNGITSYINYMKPLAIYSDKLLTLESADYKYYTDQGFTPYACTFTYPDEATVKSFVKSVKGRLKQEYVPLEKGTQQEQRAKMEKDIYSWVNAMNKLLPRSTPITNGNVYFELTKKGRIHGHGLIFIYNSYTKGLSQMMTLQWARISKGCMKAMNKTNATGGMDYAFDKCNNVKSWLTYCSKEWNVDSLERVATIE